MLKNPQTKGPPCVTSDRPWADDSQKQLGTPLPKNSQKSPMAAYNGIIWSPVEEEWVLSVPGRRNLAPRADLVVNDPRDRVCPFCPGAPEATIPGRVRAVPSKHPMVSSDEGKLLHWVLIYGESHEMRLSELPKQMTAQFIEAISLKTVELFESCEEVRAVFAFESVGDHFGPTIAHPHGQLVGLPFTPRRLSVSGSACELCDRETAELTIFRTSTATLAVPPWARLPFEMVVFPKTHHRSLTTLDSSERQDLAACIQKALVLAVATYGGRRPPYLLNVMQAARDDELHHLRIEIVPLHKDSESLKRPGGMELGLGVYLNPLTTLAAADMLRLALNESNC